MKIPPEQPTPIEERIASYLGNGGLFNPEHMDHDKVRDLIMECREEIEQLGNRLESFHEIVNRKNTIIRLMAMGDCTTQELGLSDEKQLAP